MNKQTKKEFHEIYPLEITGLNKNQINKLIKDYKEFMKIKQKEKD